MEHEAKLESQLCDFPNTCPQAAVWEEPQLRRTPRLTVSAARPQVAQKTKQDLTTGIHQWPRYTITTFPLPWTPFRGSWSYVPSRHGLKWPDPSQLESWCGEHSGMHPFQTWDCSLTKPCSEHSPFWEAQSIWTGYLQVRQVSCQFPENLNIFTEWGEGQSQSTGEHPALLPPTHRFHPTRRGSFACQCAGFLEEGTREKKKKKKQRVLGWFQVCIFFKANICQMYTNYSKTMSTQDKFQRLCFSFNLFEIGAFWHRMMEVQILPPPATASKC